MVEFRWLETEYLINKTNSIFSSYPDYHVKKIKKLQYKTSKKGEWVDVPTYFNEIDLSKIRTEVI